MRRNRWARTLLAVLCLCMLAGSACAERSVADHAADFWDELKYVVGSGAVKRLRVEYENDVFNATDRNYTNGVRFTWRAAAAEAVRFEHDDERPWIPPLRFTSGADEARRRLEDAECRQAALDDAEHAAGRPVCFRTAYNFVFFGHNLYTPSDIRLAPSQVPAGEHPYAAWAYIGFHRELHASDGRYWRYGVDIGCIGPCAFGRQLQTWVHRRITDSPVPQGWSAQVHTELGAVARFEYATQLWRGALAPLGNGVFGTPLAADLRPHVNAGLGNIQTYAGGGLTARLGWFRGSYDSLRLDTHPLESLGRAGRDALAQSGSETARDCDPGCSGSPPRALPRAPELFGFMRLGGDLVLWNATLQGGLFNRASPVTAAARPFLLEREFGVAAAVGELSLSFSMVGRSQWDSHGQRYGQRFGRLALEFSTRF